MMGRLCILTSLLIAITLGCRSLPVSPNADKNWIHDLQRADAIVLEFGGSTQTFDDRQTIERLAGIYSSAKFETYWQTLPANLAEKSIKIYADGVELRQLSFAGVLWEHSDDLDDRTARLSENDRLWIQGLFDAMRTGNSKIAR